VSGEKPADDPASGDLGFSGMFGKGGSPATLRSSCTISALMRDVTPPVLGETGRRWLSDPVSVHTRSLAGSMISSVLFLFLMVYRARQRALTRPPHL